MLIRRVACALVLLVVLGPSTVRAQQAPRQYIALNPLGIVFTVISAEFERALGSSFSVGATSSYWDHDDDGLEVQYLSLDGKLRYYPAARALEGFALGASFGFTTLSGSLEDDEGRETGRGNALSGGVYLDYNWLLGERQRFLIGTGLGAKRLWLLNIRDTEGVTVAYPTLRLSAGYAF